MRRIFLALIIVTLLALVSQAGVGTAQAAGPAYHIVQPGQTLFSIASMYGLSSWALAYANGLWNPDLIYSGQVLVVPSSGYNNYGRSYYQPYQVPYQYRYTRNYGYPGNSYGYQRGCYYWVRWGDTMSSIAWKFGGNAWTISSANGISNPDWIYAGQRLLIPGCN